MSGGDDGDDGDDGETPTPHPPRINLVRQIATRLRGSTIAALYDQGVQSALNFLAVLLMVRAVDRGSDTLGTAADDVPDFVLTIAALQVVMAVHRSLVVLPFIMTQSRDDSESDAGGWWVLNLGFVVVSAAVLAGVWMLLASVPSLAAFERVGWFSLVLCPAVVAYEFGRRWMYQIERYAFSNLAATLMGLGYASGIAVTSFSGGGAAATVYGYATGSAVAALVLAGFFLGHLRWSHHTWRDLRPLLPAQGWHLLSSLANMSYTTALPLLIPFFGSKEVAGTYGAIRQLVNPVLTARTALDSVEKPKAAKALGRDGVPAMQRVLRQMRTRLLALGGPALLVMALFGPAVLDWYGKRYDGTYPVLLASIGAVLMILVAQPYESRLVLTRNSRALLWAKIASGGFGVLTLALLVPPLGPLGAAIASLAAGVSSYAAMKLFCRADDRRLSGQPELPEHAATEKT